MPLVIGKFVKAQDTAKVSKSLPDQIAQAPTVKLDLSKGPVQINCALFSLKGDTIVLDSGFCNIWDNGSIRYRVRPRVITFDGYRISLDDIKKLLDDWVLLLITPTKPVY